MNNGCNFSVPVALQVNKIVTQFLDCFVPDIALVERVFFGSSCQYNPKC